MPPPGGFTADGLDRFGALPPHTQLIDAGRVLTVFEWDTQELVRSALDRLRGEAPLTEGEPTPGLMIKLGYVDPETDLLPVQVQATNDGWCSWFGPAEVALVVEAAPVGVDVRTSERAQSHQEAGVPFFWSFEVDVSDLVAHVHELSPDGRYTGPSVHRNRLGTNRPFGVDIDLNGIRQLGQVHGGLG